MLSEGMSIPKWAQALPAGINKQGRIIKKTVALFMTYFLPS
jgi:hypothetical protein